MKTQVVSAYKTLHPVSNKVLLIFQQYYLHDLYLLSFQGPEILVSTDTFLISSKFLCMSTMHFAMPQPIKLDLNSFSSTPRIWLLPRLSNCLLNTQGLTQWCAGSLC